MSAIGTDDPIVNLLRTTLDRKSMQVDVRAMLHHFDPDRPVLAREFDPRDGGHHGWRRAATVAAAIVLVIALASAVIATRTSPTKRQLTPTTISPIGQTLELPGDAPILVPATPQGMKLWSMATIGGAPQTSVATTQLFGHLDANGAPSPGLLIEISPIASHSEVMPGATQRVQVRGTSAAISASKDAGEAPQELDWIENDSVLFRVTIRGLSPESAADVIDALTPRDGNLLHGFDPASAPNDFELLGEHRQAVDTPSANDAYLAYGTHAPVPGADAELTVHTSTGYPYPGYLRTWIAGTGKRDGAMSFDPDIGLIVTRSDGQITLGPPGLGEPALERIAKTITMHDNSTAHSAREQLNRRLLGLPRLAAGDAGPVHLELRGQTVPTTVCASTTNSEAVCAPPMGIFPPSEHTVSSTFVGTARQADGWFVFGVGTTPFTFTSGEDEQGRALAVPYQLHTTIGGHSLSVAVVPDSIDSVGATTDGSSFMQVPRPAA